MARKRRNKSRNDPIRSAYWLHIKERRLAAGLTRPQLAEKCRIHELSVKNYEINKTEPTLQALIQIAAGLNLPSILDLVTVDLERVRELIAIDVIDRRPAPKETPTIAEPKPDPSRVPELQPALKIGADAEIADKFENPVGDLMAAQEGNGEKAK